MPGCPETVARIMIHDTERNAFRAGFMAASAILAPERVIRESNIERMWTCYWKARNGESA